ncbi:MAG: polysaccharide biosynthesis/export family protein [Desulfobacterales bacterium]
MNTSPRQLNQILILLSVIITLVIFNGPLGNVFAGEQSTAIIKKRVVYLIGSGDLLNIITWTGGTEFTREEMVVRIDGKITLPLLNDIHAVGKTPVQLKKEIEKGLAVFVESPAVNVIVKEQASKRFYIIGEILHSGQYPLTKQLTVLQAISTAGGFTGKASKDEILLIRENPGGNVTFRINYNKIMKGIDLDTNISIRPDDTIIIP